MSRQCERKSIIIFSRVPQPGKTKTRLQPVLTPEQCAMAHTSFLKDVYHTCNAFLDRSRQDGNNMGIQTDLFVFYTPDISEAIIDMQTILGDHVHLLPQQGETLGEKMYNSIRQVINIGFDKCVLVGSDIPQLTEQHLVQAFDLLVSSDVVLGPSHDGGYYLIGMKQPYKGLFRDFTEGSHLVLQQTIERASDEGLSCGIAPKCADIDLPEDLCKLADEVKSGKHTTYHHTRMFLDSIGLL